MPVDAIKVPVLLAGAYRHIPALLVQRDHYCMPCCQGLLSGGRGVLGLDPPGKGVDFS